MTSSDKVKTPFPAASILTAVSFFIIAGASALMVLAARGDLWFDEIWSLFFAESAITPLDILTMRHDNNHPLNTFFLFLVGQRHDFIIYRLFAVFSGICSLFLVGCIARKIWGRIEGLYVQILCGFSFPLILFFSEARGYAPAILFSLLAFFCLILLLEKFTVTKLLFFWSACILGVLSHATFIIVFLSLIAYSVSQQYRKTRTLNQQIFALTRVYGVPAAFITVFFLYYVVPMTIGGGPPFPPWQEIIKLMAYALGLPHIPVMAAISVSVTAAIIIAGIVRLYVKRDTTWLFFLMVLVILPAMPFVLYRPRLLYFRYYIVCLPFFYLLMSSLLGAEYRSRNEKGGWVTAIIILVFIFGQAQRTLPLIIKGRGNYKAALEDITRYSNGNTVTISSDHDDHTLLLITFYSRFLPPSSEIFYIRTGGWGEKHPDWMITHDQVTTAQPRPLIILPNIDIYRLFGEYRYCGYGSGWHWFVYRKSSTGE